MRAAILATAGRIPVREVYAGLEVLGNSDLNLMTKSCVREAVVKSRGRIVFDFDGTGWGCRRFVDKSEMARTGQTN